MKDRAGRKITLLRVSVTGHCNLRCEYCFPHEGSPNGAFVEWMSFENIFEVVRVAVDMGIRRVRITGGEPLTRPGLVGLIESLSTIDALEEIAMTTNGVLLARYAADLWRLIWPGRDWIASISASIRSIPIPTDSSPAADVSPTR